MPILRVIRGDTVREMYFEGQPLLGDALRAGGFSVPRPCGGRGMCGKCAAALKGAVSLPTEAELRLGVRLSCQTVLKGDCEVTLTPEHEMCQIELDSPMGPNGLDFSAQKNPDENAPLGAAVDIGTTTLALKLFSLPDGHALASAAAMNPQTSTSADVMGRIGAAMNGSGALLREQITEAIAVLLDNACRQAGRLYGDVQKMVVTGNTTMLYLLTGRPPDALSRAPFAADCLFDIEERLLGIPTYYPACMHAFVGADITCAVLASGLCEHGDTALLLDIGTNGEMALWKDNTLSVASTAAGPAFEGAGIVMGCGSVAGAIDKVWTENFSLGVHTIGGAPAVGICGSGLIDAVAALLQLERIDETGAADEEKWPLADDICLYPRDIRAVQLAKAAIGAGTRTLMEQAEVRPRDIARLLIAGGFGRHLNLSAAAAIGLIDASLIPRTRAIGNAALAGAAEILLHPSLAQTARTLAKSARHVDLGGNPRFNELYIDSMMFPMQA